MDDIYGLLLILAFLIIISQCTSSQIEKMTNKSKDGQKLPSTLRLQHEGPVGGYTPGEVILADANTPYGADIPISMQQEYTTLKSFGKLENEAKGYVKAEPGASINGKPSDSQLSSFDPSSKGGLLPSQQKSALGQDLFTDKGNIETPSNGNGNGQWQVYGSQKCGWTVKQLKYMDDNNIGYSYTDCKQSQCPSWVKGFPSLVSPTGEQTSGYKEM
tara:strand:- start:216 stop:863 length:648 start_codon:yes stop_codon:yes gene_type:complete